MGDYSKHQEVGENMKELRKKAGITGKELSEKTGISIRTIQAYEQGYKDINGAKLKTLLKLCHALGCGLEDIITDEETKELLRAIKKEQQ